MSVYRIYVEKKPAFAVEADSTRRDIKASLGISLTNLRLFNRYDVEGIDEAAFDMASKTIFSEPPVDNISLELPELAGNQRLLAVEYLPGQFDQRADSCEQCIQIMTQGDRPAVRNARIYLLEGDLTEEQFAAIKNHLINPVEAREASLEKADTLKTEYEIPTTVETLTGFTGLDEKGLAEFVANYGLAMDLDDIKFCQDYFKNTERRDPTITEIRMIDTYWSDHCRHTTFGTIIDRVEIDDETIRKSFDKYVEIRDELYVGRNKPMTLMDLATIGAKKLKKDGKLKELDESEEINACSVKINVDVDGVSEKWLLQFKNETHNHPTEIEPFGGAATCLGGAIRDPLSGRAYVYQAMRVTGAADPTVPFSATIPGKLPQKKLVTTAAHGYSSYGNQIGLATGEVTEIYHPNYAAKRMEIGAVVGAVPESHVVRDVPDPGDIVILLGGRTGRDGCGGATGSSKSHTKESIHTCGAEVQKGNPPIERKISRLFRNPEVTRMIRRCNDFGAGGVSVAIGELADGLSINLDAVPKKYDGLDGTELAISESQERMAVVVSPENADKFMELARKENLEATKVAVVTEEPRLTMDWCGNRIVNLSREFLNSNGAEKHTTVHVCGGKVKPVNNREDTKEDWIAHFSDLNICSQKGLVERFDSSIGAGTVTMPYGGKYQMTKTQAMAAKLPVLQGETNTCSIMGWGYNPYITEQNPYLGAMYAVVESVAKVVAAGGTHSPCWLTFQEYFERMKTDPKRWGKPMAALLGGMEAQLQLGCAAIGGKDSMSGTFEDIDVPPTLVSFAISTGDARTVISPEFKQIGSTVILVLPKYNADGTPDFESVKNVFTRVEKMIQDGQVLSAWTLGFGGVSEAVFKMALGNRVGFKFAKQLPCELLFNPVYGGFVLELAGGVAASEEEIIGMTLIQPVLENADGKKFSMIDEFQKAYEERLEKVFPCNIETSDKPVEKYSYVAQHRPAPAVKVASPRVLIPVFPGTNCEYDTQRAFERAGANTDIFVINNLSSAAIEESVDEFAKRLRKAQIVMIPGGFSGGDEPDGSGKFITAFFRNPRIKDGVHELLKNRDGLMLGICNGFQALIKLGLVPYGEIVEMTEDSPTLTFNSIGRHQSRMVMTRIASNKSPWLAHTNVGDYHSVPISHGEGRFAASDEWVRILAKNGQIATQYVDLTGQPTYDIRFNPNMSAAAIEGITSPDGRVLGKMAHSERAGENIAKNIDGDKDQMIFKSGVEYFR
ncbi:MAG TPA: phosphoribosylformylglycinamidine synthase [Candidatus Merdivicinus excrementipullorum]|uniref:Phosphoribosylformylglycinamidine synthase n=1 Tax=Candidatus Merdivicinus excrementipullorum TaxID=2840867 RepID=A0A9D1FL24_9FIRM|nr:phosphoribosylformylglycinamidine synthase [Candidatus Merdivicinus excrementipullorum]